jgi:acetyl-CoA/propionyl-CoA carboxylase biotin carboxyl carrier protein
VGFHKALLSHECFVNGETCHGLVESEELAAQAAALDGGSRARASPSSAGGRTVERTRTVEVEGRRFDVRMLEPEPPWRELSRRRVERGRSRGKGGNDAIESPMQGTVLSVAVANGDAVETGQVLCIVEAMKMENEVRAPHGGVVAELSVVAGEPVGAGQVICVLVVEE